MDVIETPRLMLRRAQMADLADLHRVFSDPLAMRYWSTPPNRDIAQTRGWLAGMVGAGPPESDDFVVELEGQVIGKAGCWACPEIGVMLRPDCWGRGLAREALTAAIAHAWVCLPTDVLTADVDPRNAPCLRLLEGLGFRETGRAARTFCIDGVWVDSVYLALAR